VPELISLYQHRYIAKFTIELLATPVAAPLFLGGSESGAALDAAGLAGAGLAPRLD
jgi:hypothetical protein